MRYKGPSSASLVACSSVVLLAFAFVGCPTNTEKTTVTTLFTGGTALKASVPADDIESLTVTITEIALDYAGPQTGSSKIVVFSGSMDVNVKDLMGVSEVLSSGEIPTGEYTKVRLSIENPRLVLAADPATEITDVHLTAGGRLFVSEQFTLPEGEASLLILNFGGLHLVAQGNGAYTLTPQLDVTIDVESAEVSLAGTITAVDAEAAVITVALEEGDVQVLYGSAAIYLPEDTDVASGTPEDLDVSDSVEVAGTIAVDGTVTAETIRILPPPAE